jgi:hypothetical protein
MIDRLDEQRLEILRGWGAGLASDEREELRAAGKAITVLIEEIDRLQVDLWNARVDQRDPPSRCAKPGGAAEGPARGQPLACLTGLPVRGLSVARKRLRQSSTVRSARARVDRHGARGRMVQPE